MHLLKDVEEIPSLQELNIDEVVHFKHPLYKKLLSMKKINRCCFGMLEI